jgi:hypothetical protein
MSEEEKQRDVTRKELAEALAKSNALVESQGAAIARLEALLAAKAEPTLGLQEAILQRELAAANAELKDKRELLERVRSRPGASGPDIKLVPYSGMVVSTAVCCPDHRREVGEVFLVNLPALYTDDPFEPVTVLETDENGVAIKWEPNKAAPTPIDFRFRKVVSAAEDPTPRRAAEY